jgi:hypothetical protein
MLRNTMIYYRIALHISKVKAIYHFHTLFCNWFITESDKLCYCIKHQTYIYHFSHYLSIFLLINDIVRQVILLGLLVYDIILMKCTDICMTYRNLIIYLMKRTIMKMIKADNMQRCCFLRPLQSCSNK